MRAEDGKDFGTILAAYNLELAWTPAWDGLGHETITGYRSARGGITEFRRTAEAFAALATSRVLSLVANVGYG
jgi:hypothetical protein